MPDTFRGLYRGDTADISASYLSHLERILDSLKKKNERISAFISESILG